MRILHIDCGLSPTESVSRMLTREVVQHLAGKRRSLEIIYRDLIKDPLPYATFQTLPGFHPSAASEETLAECERTARLSLEQALNEFLTSEVIVLGVPMYNFGIPAQLKSWFDAIVIPGKTYAYTPDGPRGLAGAKRVIVAASRGGVFGEAGFPIQMEHAEAYVRCVLSLIGITGPEVVLAEGVARDRAGAIERAREKVLMLSPL